MELHDAQTPRWVCHCLELNVRATRIGLATTPSSVALGTGFPCVNTACDCGELSRMAKSIQSQAVAHLFFYMPQDRA
jgi:hypothetical protein